MKNRNRPNYSRSRHGQWPIRAALLLALAAACVFAFFHFSEKSQTYTSNVSSYSTETPAINFDDPEIMVHAADYGIAVINPATTEARASRSVADPSEIWQGEAVHTHGGFTLPVAMDGESIGVLTIPDIGLSVRVYEGDNYMALMERGVWHFRHASAWYGNISLSAHNINLDGSPGYFLHLYRLSPGAVIRYQTALGVREYTVETITEISQYDWSLLDRTEDNRITLITCISGRADMRLVVQGIERTPD